MCCLLDETEQCLYEKCRYFTNDFCALSVIHESGWPHKDCRSRNKNVKQDKPELKEMSEHGPGCCSD